MLVCGGGSGAKNKVAHGGNPKRDVNDDHNKDRGYEIASKFAFHGTGCEFSSFDGGKLSRLVTVTHIVQTLMRHQGKSPIVGKIFQ